MSAKNSPIKSPRKIIMKNVPLEPYVIMENEKNLDLGQLIFLILNYIYFKIILCFVFCFFS